MRKFRFQLYSIISLLLLTVTSVWAQNKVMQVHSGGNVVYEIPTAQVDSVTFKKQPYYYAYDEKVFLNEVENKLVVCFQVTSATEVKALIDPTEIESQNDSLCIVVVENNTRKETLRSDLLQIDGIKSVQPMYTTVIGETEMGVTDEIVMKFKEDISQQQIDELHKKYGACIKEITRLYQLVSVSKYADALEIANQYQLSGLVVYSHPNFLSKAILYSAKKMSKL